MVYCHSPFKLCQCARTICGRGYSGKGLDGFTSFAQRVMRLPVTGCQVPAPKAPVAFAQISRMKRHLLSIGPQNKRLDVAHSQLLQLLARCVSSELASDSGHPG